MKKLVQLHEHTMVHDPNVGIAVDNACAEWGGAPYPQLSVLLVHLRFLSFVHQNHHWVAKGDPFYGDHSLFGELYSNVVGEVDSIAERAVGLGTSQNVDVSLHTSQLLKLVQGYGMTQTIPQPNELARRSLQAEINFLKTCNILVQSMKEAGTLTRGLDNLIAGIEDQHETHVYKLKQRVK